MCAFGVSAQGESMYKQKFADPNAEYFTPENYGIKADGKMDVSEQLQAAINKVKSEKSFGTLYIPEGKYLISKTIYVPGAVRLIGYGAKRPEIILAKNTFVDEEGWMFWYTSGMVTPERAPGDAGAGTFYSGFSNINLRIEKGNPMAIALRTHYAQHGVLNHVDIHAGDAYACLRDVGNEMENVRFFGGQYGITSGPTSPSWPMAIADVYFEGQKKAAVVTRNASISFVNMVVKNAPIGILMEKGVTDRVYIEESQFENVGTAVVTTVEDEAVNQINILGLLCKNVPTLLTTPGESVPVAHKIYNVKDLTYGLIIPEMGAIGDFDLTYDVVPASEFKLNFKRTIPALPEMNTWVSVLDFGAKGDGETDDTEAIKKAIASAQNVFFPEGWYRITETIKMQPNTAIIGMHPFATQFVLAESTPAFSGFGSPVAMVESSKGTNIFNGIGITTGGYNNRAVGIKWMADAASLMNDVKFVGGHGTMSKPRPANAPAAPRQSSYSAASRISSPSNPIAVQGLDQAWDNQYWSLWITDGGGGTFKDIWTANTYAGSGLYVSNTDTPTRMYAVSLEHHVRTESRFSNVKNWKLYAMQYEEESREGEHCVSLVMDNCENMLFANSRFYRVIRVKTPRDFGMQVSNSKNIEFRNMHTWTQILYMTASTVYDVNKNINLYANDFARATITGNEKSARPAGAVGEVVKIGKGYRFATGAVADSKGNVYFCEYQLKKIHKWDAATGTISVLADYPYKPFSLAMDTEDNLIVICRYDPQPGYLVDGRPEVVSRLPDDNPDYSGWGNSGWAALAFAIDTKSESDTMIPMKRVATASVKSPKRVVVPTHRYRGDFSEVAQAMPENSFLAPDGVTIIPETYDLGRSVQLASFAPSQSAPVYMAWENYHTVSQFKANADGRLSEVAPKMFKRGEYSVVTDKAGNVYIAEGDIFVFNPAGELINTITCEERPMSMAFGGKDGNTLFITTNNSLYKVRVK